MEKTERGGRGGGWLVGDGRRGAKTAKERHMGEGRDKRTTQTILHWGVHCGTGIKRLNISTTTCSQCTDIA